MVRLQTNAMIIISSVEMAAMLLALSRLATIVLEDQMLPEISALKFVETDFT